MCAVYRVLGEYAKNLMENCHDPGARGGADTLLLYVVPRFVMYTASALESWANLRKET
jgi:hypothetical protein